MSPADEAAALARAIVERSGVAEAPLRDAGLLDEDLDNGVRLAVSRELGRADLSAAEPLLGGDPLLVAGALCGAAAAALDLGMAYAGQRVVFGKPLSRMQVQRHAFALAVAEVTAADALLRRVAQSAVPDELEAEACLPVAKRAAWLAVETALQVHGGYGYTDDYPVSAIWRAVVSLRARV
jgi:alkylation response protein AidB-like acyl-CoA dehydrogenase